MSALPQPLKLRVQRLEWLAEGVLEVELRGPENLPEFTSGAHIDLHLPNGISRSYSLANAASERHRYCVGVGLEASSRGGSRYIHTQLRPGQSLEVAPPRNNFPLDESAEHSVLLAGGIGVTPILAHARRLQELGRKFEVHHAVRERSRAAYAEALEEACSSYQLHVDAEHQGQVLDISEIVGRQPLGTHFYCCGPPAMMSAFEQAVAAFPANQVHVEYFVARAQKSDAGDAEFLLRLERSGKEFSVPAGRSALEVLLENGIRVPSSCRDGICGSCETRVLEGVPDHRDSVLSQAEKLKNRTVMLCVSRCQGEFLVVDL